MHVHVLHVYCTCKHTFVDEVLHVLYMQTYISTWSYTLLHVHCTCILHVHYLYVQCTCTCSLLHVQVCVCVCVCVCVYTAVFSRCVLSLSTEYSVCVSCESVAIVSVASECTARLQTH